MESMEIRKKIPAKKNGNQMRGICLLLKMSESARNACALAAHYCCATQSEEDIGSFRLPRLPLESDTCGDTNYTLYGRVTCTTPIMPGNRGQDAVNFNSLHENLKR